MSTKITTKDLMTYSPWEIAKDNGLGYTGDLNFVQHGGKFYEMSDWAEHGYAECVNIFSLLDEGDALVCIEKGTINRAADMSAAFKCMGLVLEDEETVSVAYEIEASLAYRGIEVDFTECFEADDERGICRKVKQYLLQIKGAYSG